MSANNKPKLKIMGAGATGKTAFAESIIKDAQAKGKKVYVFKPSEKPKDLADLLSKSMLVKDEPPLFIMKNILQLESLSPRKKRKKRGKNKRK